MATSSFNVQDMPFSRLLQLPEDNRDYDSLQTFKPLSDYSINHQHYQPDYYNFSELIESACSSSASYLNESGCEQQTMTVDVPQVDSTLNPSTRKRKGSFRDTVSDFEESNGDDSKSVKTSDESKKQNHSEIEKRRRDKMNTYITELSSMVPMCSAMSRKLDKLTVLRMAVQHLKSIKGAVHSYTEGQYKPSFLSDSELKHLILQIADGFLFVVGCDRGKILFVSESVSKVLSFTKGELLGQSLFDVLHPKDVAKVKEQLTSSDLNPRERLIDAKTMLPVKTDVPQGTTRLCPGARRSFFCRMKNKIQAHDAAVEESDSSANYQQKKTPVKRYSVIHCTGYLKSWPPSKVGLEEGEHEGDADPDNLSCLVAIGRVLPPISSIVGPTEKKSVNIHPIQFISRHSLDGKFLFVDQRATLVLGFLPQELLGSSMYEYYHQDDIPLIAECHRRALQVMEPVKSQLYRFRSKDDGFIKLQSEIRAFRNPWTDEIEYIIAKNDFVHAEPKAPENGKEQYETLEENYEFLSPTSSNTMQKIINIHVEASNIGRHIVDQATLDHQQQWEDNSLENSQADESNSLHLAESQEVVPTCEFPQNEFGLNCGIESNRSTPLPTPPSDTATPHPSQRLPQNSGELPNGGICESSDGNDEAAMAVIMSLLEADAGLGGPVDFSGLPWPLP